MERRFGADIWDRVSNGMLDIRVPGRTLVIHDLDDVMVPIDQAKLVTTQGHPHNGVLQAPEAIDRIAALASHDLSSQLIITLLPLSAR